MNVWTYFLRRLAAIPPTILIILLFIFVTFSLIGNPSPVSTQLPPYSDSVRSFLGAYWTFVTQILTGNWGYLGALPKQLTYSGKLSLLVTIYLYSTLQVVLLAAPLALAISFPLGRYLGTNHTEKKAKFLRGAVVIAYLTPAYIVAILLQVFLGKGVIKGDPFGVFPVIGATDITAFPFGPPKWMLSSGGILVSNPTHMVLFDSIIHFDYTVAANAFMHLVLPVLTLMISILGVVTFLLESGYVDNIGKEYVKGARSKGMIERDVILKHVRRNAVMPVMASTTIMVAYLLSNIVMMEYIFSYPGIGMFLYTTITHGQYYPTAVIIFLFSLIVIIMGLVIDTLYYIKNPLIRK